ncbi:hypothetical protein ACFE04_005476 [Oxalis oulophora]
MEAIKWLAIMQICFQISVNRSLYMPITLSPRKSSLESPQRASPRSARQLKTVGLEPNSVSSSSSSTRTPKARSPKVILERRSPRSPVSEKKRPSKISELESQISQLQDDLKKTKDQLSATELSKKQVELDAVESQKQILELNLKVEESQKKLPELFTNEAGLGELQNTIHEAGQTKSTDSELQILKELTKTLAVIENMKEELKTSKESEIRAEALARETLLQLENAKKTMEALESDSVKATEAYKCIFSELEDSKARVNFLEGLVCKLNADLKNAPNDSTKHTIDYEGDLPSLKSEVAELRSSLEAAEARFQEEQVQSTVELRSAYEMVEKVKSESSSKEIEFQKVKSEIEEMKASLMDKETELQIILEENEQLHIKLEKNSSKQGEFELEKELKKVLGTVRDLKGNLMDKETELQNISEENKVLMMEIRKMDNVNKNIAEIEAAKAAEREAVIKLEIVMDEADRTNRKASRVAEQLDAAQAVNAEMEAELRKLKVQSDQWRKAAEAAAAMLSAGQNGKFMERTGSLDSNYNPVSGKISSPYNSEDIDDDLLKKKNGNMLKKIGGLWKKPQK